MTKLKKGSKGPDVEQIQQQLNKAGAKPKVKPDGKFGAKTETALKAFQKKNRLKDDGVAGTKTLAMLKRRGGVVKPAAAPKWPYEDYAKIVPSLEKNTKQIVADSKKNLMEMDGHLNDFDIEKLRDEYFGNLRKYLAFHKMWVANATKVVKFQQSFEKLVKRNPAAGPEIIKVAGNTVKSLEKINRQADPLLLRNADIVDKFRTMVTKKAA